MFSDIIGYSSLMAMDECQAIITIEKNRAIHKKSIKLFNGVFIKEMGDGILSVFDSSFHAIQCALEIQKACDQESSLKVRIGIHTGDILWQDGDIFGDGVNIASRIEASCKPGEIYISGRVQEDLENKSDINTEFVAVKSFKNIPHAINIYRVIQQKKIKDFKEVKKEITTANSIAVLPFTNMSPDPEQDYFCDGMAEELMNALSRIPKLKVVARTSSFAFKQEMRDIREIGRKLNVNMLVEGSVRKSGNRLRIHVQLIKVEDGYHLWSERYDRKLEDVFAIQDEITIQIVNRLKSSLALPEMVIVNRRHGNLVAYDYYLQGRYQINKFYPESIYGAIDLYSKAFNWIRNLVLLILLWPRLILYWLQDLMYFLPGKLCPGHEKQP
jgi:TolB-like protein